MKRRLFLLAYGLFCMVFTMAQPMEQREQSGVYSNYVESRQRPNEVQPMEQREQSDACINYVESRQRSNEVQPMEQREQSDACINYSSTDGAARTE